jgi:molybdopterin-guanine dinucleotide biosynthesis protein A
MRGSATADHDNAAIVLAGGRSRRFGRDKARALLLGKPLLAWVVEAVREVVDEVVVVRRSEQALPDVGDVALVEDLFPETGPLGGLYTGLQATLAPRAVVVACDMPLLQPALLSELLRLGEGHEIVAPVADGMPQPLCAVYGVSSAEALRKAIDAEEYRLTDFVAAQGAYLVGPEFWRTFDPEGLSFLNVNRETELVHIEQIRAATKKRSAFSSRQKSPRILKTQRRTD